MPRCPFKYMLALAATVFVCFLAGQQLQAMYPRQATITVGAR
jgi:hypothetical protein